MTLRGVIQGLMRGSDDAEALLADDGYSDLPPEMFSQALSSYADTAPMAEADALTPILASIDAGDASDVFAILEEQPPVVDASGGAELAGVAASVAGAEAFDDDPLDDFGAPAPETVDDELTDLDEVEASEVDEFDAVGETDADPFEATDELIDDAPVDSAGEFEELEDFFDSEPTATGDDPSDLDF